MLKPAEPRPGEPDPAQGKPIGELINQLVDNGKAYAQAELNVAKAVLEEKTEAFRLSAILGLTALLFLQAAVVLLGLTVYATLNSRLGPLLAGLISTLLFLGIAGGLGWYAVQRLRSKP